MKTVKVNSLKKVDVTRYKEGDLFLTEKEQAILQEGKLDPLVKQSDLKGYIKKKDVQKMIDEAIGKGESK